MMLFPKDMKLLNPDTKNSNSKFQNFKPSERNGEIHQQYIKGEAVDGV